MNALYKHDYLFERLALPEARAYALRGFMATLMRHASMPTLVADLVVRYAPEEALLEQRGGARGRAFKCAVDSRGTPTSRASLSRTKFEVILMWDEHLLKLPPPVRAILLSDLIEELTAQTLGAAETLPFWRDCFGPNSPRFFRTQPNSIEHERLWRGL